jgi:hypothetical protein
MTERLMNKQTVALIALFAGWLLAADIANATTPEDMAGQWCGDVTDYVFAPDTLTVKFHDSRPDNVFKITKYTYTDDSVRIHWLNGADELVMVFAEFNGSHTTMAQHRFAPMPFVITMTSVRSFMSIQYPRRTSLFSPSRTNGLFGSTVRSGS